MFLFDTNEGFFFNHHHHNNSNNNNNNDDNNSNSTTIVAQHQSVTNKQQRNKNKKSRNIHTIEAKAAAKAKKVQQDDMDSLQITFYEIESWIEKTSPVLSRMTKELDKASRHFEKRKRILPPSPSSFDETTTPIKTTTTTTTTKAVEAAIDQDVMNDFLSPLPPPSTRTTTMEMNDDLSSMQWALSFQPGNNMRLETNIKSIEQLIDAVQKMKLLTETTPPVPDLYNEEEFEYNTSSSSSSTSSSSSSNSSISSSSAVVIVDPSIEYWNIAMYKRPTSCLDKYKHMGEMNLNGLTQDVSPSVLTYICQTYWDCLHPKFSADWTTFWDRSGDAARNQVCIDSGLAMVFVHIIRHNKNACANAQAIAYYYYDRAREALMDYFDDPDVATIETLLNLAMFCVLCKKISQSRIYIGLAYRMMHQLNINEISKSKTTSRMDRKIYLKLYMVLYYNDIMISVYSGEPTLVMDDTVCNINFYDLITLNQQLMENQEVNLCEKVLAKESFFVYILELAKIGKRIQQLTTEYQRQNLQHHHSGTLPLRWAKKIQELEIALATWFDKLPIMYRVDPKPTMFDFMVDIKKDDQQQQQHQHQHQHANMNATMLKEQSALLLMLQYQTQWIQLHKTFLSPTTITATTTTATTTATTNGGYRTKQSYDICTDAANRIVILSEIITQCYDWCVCQQYVNCVYQASTVFCKSVINKDAYCEASKAMIHRITSVLAASKMNYKGLPVDLTDCLNDFLAENDGETTTKKTMDQWTKSCLATTTTTTTTNSLKYHTVIYNDTMYNSPHMYKKCMEQQTTSTYNQTPLNATYKQGPPSEAMFSIKIQNPNVVVPMDLEPDNNKNWRCKFSSSNITHVM